MATQVRSHWCGLVHAPAVEDEYERPTQMAPEAAEEVDQIDGPNVLPLPLQYRPRRRRRGATVSTLATESRL